MRIPILFCVSAILCVGLAAGARTAPSNSAGQAPSSAKSDKTKPSASTGGVELLSDTQGVDFGPYLREWHRITQATWEPLLPNEVKAPTLKSGIVVIRFKILPDGHLKDGAMVLEGRAGDTALDRAAWGALQGSKYPPLPREFHGPFVELRAHFLYNKELLK